MKKNKIKKSIFIPVCVVLSIVGILYLSILYFIDFGRNPVSSQINYQTYEIESNNLIEITDFLKEEGLIRNKFAFYISAQLTGTSGKIGKGKYELSPSMTTLEIINVLETDGIKEDNTIMVTIPEGYTVEKIATLLYENKVIYDKEIFLDLCKTGTKFKNNSALTGVDFDINDESIKYILEGYLFPDTYEFYLNSSSEDVINKMLNKFDDVFNNTYEARMKELGYSKNDVIILASIIEKEGKIRDFNRISSVLYNRLNINMPLQVDATVRYMNNMSNSISITAEQYSENNAYNTYKNRGLPPTAICNPSKNAIKAVLYPDEEYINENYLYFCLTDYDSGNMIFSKTYEEHLNNVKKYKDNWQAYDAAIE